MKKPMDAVAKRTSIDHSGSGTAAVICLCIFAFISSLVVALRIWARRLTCQPYGLDTYLCLAALIMQHVLMTCSVVGIIHGGFGQDMRITSAKDPHSVVVLFQAIFVSELAYTYSSPLVKLSVLAFYRRVFPTSVVKICSGILGVMCIACTILDFTECRPLKAYWFVELQALSTTKCLDSVLSFLAHSIANTIIDFFTLTLPIYDVMKLRTTTRRKIQICGVFFMGSIAFAASLVRTILTGLIWKEGISNFTEQFFVPGLATVIEIYMAIIGACLPTLVPVYRKLRYGDRFKSRTSELPGRTPAGVRSSAPAGWISNKKRSGHDGGSFYRLANSEDGFTPAAYYENHHVDISSTGQDQNIPYMTTESHPLGTVMVRRDMTWSVHNKGSTL
ncbi:hypothetical protein GGR52DRAFT_556061 [Hypoxylon sp. FL1284]|nr:hypothetical protein GGR52DRAFT_556061 [Hypoxylon sp. FL1284]